MRVLVTGVTGSIGRVVAAGLTDRGHEVRGLDVRTPDEATEEACGAGFVRGDCLDPTIVAEALLTMDGVVHLAGTPTDDNLAASFESHVQTTRVLLESMIEFGVLRIVYASSNHAVGKTPRTDLLTVDTRPRPDTHYGVAKVAAEALLSLYVDRHHIDAVALRIGSFLDAPETRRNLATWLSPSDAVALVDSALTAPSPGFAVVYGISANTDAWWDHSPGHDLGYRPADDAKPYEPRLPHRPEDDAEGSFVGGPYAL